MHSIFILPFWDKLYDPGSTSVTTNRRMIEFARKPGQQGVACLRRWQLFLYPNILLLRRLKRKDRLAKLFNYHANEGRI